MDEGQLSSAGIGSYMFYVNLILVLGMPVLHFALGPARSRKSRGVLLGLMLLWLVLFLSYGFFKEVPFRDVILALISYCVVLFIFLSEVLMTGGAAWLTRRRGEYWTKEIDYIYLGLAAIGLVVSIGQLQSISYKMTLPSTFGPLILATAIVLRAIKTRAEIGGWNKSEFGVSKT